MQAFTDYPFQELGDRPGEPAPCRKCTIVSYDGNKYCRIEIQGVRSEVKAGYLYSKPRGFGKTHLIDLSQVPNEE